MGVAEFGRVSTRNTWSMETVTRAIDDAMEW